MEARKRQTFFCLGLALLPACADDDSSQNQDSSSTSEEIELVSSDPSDLPIPDLPEEWQKRFDDGDVAFEAVFRESQGLGPVYIRHSCSSCHADDARGPGAVRKMVVLEPDSLTPAEDQSALPYGHTVRPQRAGTAIEGITIPEIEQPLLVSTRFGPAVYGRGYLEAVADSEIERVEFEQSLRTDGISGRIHRVSYQSQANPDLTFHAFTPETTGLIGRFGLKARIATIDDFTADAYQGDMGITSPLRPDELPMPPNIEDFRPGIDLDAETVNLVADYVRLLRIPKRQELPERGPELFAAADCSVCHVPNLRTRADYPITALANIDAPIFTDLLLHDMGVESSDGLQEFDASPQEWKTPPLIGLRHLRNYLHDGRAKTIEAAILMHRGIGSEANHSIDLFDSLIVEDRAILVDYVAKL